MAAAPQDADPWQPVVRDAGSQDFTVSLPDIGAGAQ
jgi:hypothetical protein